MKALFKPFKSLLNNKEEKDLITLKPEIPAAPLVVDASHHEGYLAGQLLVATPLINTGCFQKSVVYIFAHNNEGAMGVIINQSMELMSYAALSEGMNLPEGPAMKQLPIHFGGPVERSRGFVLHSTDYYKEFSLARSNEVAITASAAILADIANGKGPQNAALIVGYAGWAPGQLEQEIESNSWIHVPATAQLVFGTENDLKWISASESLGVNMAFFSPTVGHA